MDDMRKAFEAWVDEAHGLWIAPNDDGTYADSRTQYMWNAWQAATLAALEDIAGHLFKRGYESDPSSPDDVCSALWDLLCDFEKAEHGRDEAVKAATLAERNAAEQDAKRYRYLRQCRYPSHGAPFVATFNGSFSAWDGEDADRLIDAAIRGK